MIQVIKRIDVILDSHFESRLRDRRSQRGKGDVYGA